MNELLRLDYLNAMGITQYVARAPLPGARPSPVVHLDIAPPATERATSITALLNDELPYKKLSAGDIAKPLTENPVTANLVAAKPITEKLIVASDTAATSSPTTFHCQIAIWIVSDLLVLADAPRLDNQQLTLLRNILQAIGRTDNLPDVRQFSWPLPQRKDKSLLAATEHFQGLLDGGLLQTAGLRQILCFGSTINTLLGAYAETQLQQYQDWPVTTVCALHEMLVQPLKKADTWRTLQILVRN